VTVQAWTFVMVGLAVALHPFALPSLAKVALALPLAVGVLFAAAPWLRRAPLLGRVL